MEVSFNTATTDDSFGSLTINNLSGDGLFNMREDVVNNRGDLINVTGKTSGSHQIVITNDASEETNGTETLTLVKTADGQGAFSLKNSVELGGYVYGLHQADNDWELYSTGKKQSSSSQGSASFLNTGYLINYAEIQSLLQRVGDLRQGNQDDNVWVHIFTGKFDAFSSHSLDSFDMHYHGLQLGADKSYSFEKGLVYMGAFVGFTDSSQNYSDGNGSLNSNSAGVYATYIMNSGGYLDGVLKYQHIKNELDVVDTQGDKVNGDGSSNGFTASIEGGHRFSFNHESDGWYIEPQIQSTYTRQGSSTINNSNGLTVNLDSYESLLSRVGILMGYEINQPDENPINIYLKNSWLHEFDGDASYKLNGSKEEISFSGDAWTSGVGLSVLINKKHTLYVDVERTLGNKFNQSRANIGYRFSF